MADRHRKPRPSHSHAQDNPHVDCRVVGSITPAPKPTRFDLPRAINARLRCAAAHHGLAEHLPLVFAAAALLWAEASPEDQARAVLRAGATQSLEAESSVASVRSAHRLLARLGRVTEAPATQPEPSSIVMDRLTEGLD